ncbi:MAG TPA: M36 family metallopeptidase, partial [Saprospiraceae bacterium]|nr:M36 family metallopeptidase [Saprospiraceae bacterium]
MHTWKRFCRFSIVSQLLFAAVFISAQSGNSLRELVLKEASKTHGSSDLAEAKVSSSYTTAGLNVTHVYLSQYFQGIPVEGGIINAAIRNGSIVNFNSRFIPYIDSKVSRTNPQLNSDIAMRTAALEVQMVLPGQMGTPKIEYNSSGLPIKYAYAPIHPNEEQPTIGLKWMQDAGRNSKQVHLVWEVVLENPDSQSIWHVFVDAMDGKIMSKYDAVIKCFAVDHDHFPGSSHAIKQTSTKKDSPRILGMNMPLMSAGYRVFDLPLEAPSFGSRTLVADPWDRNGPGNPAGTLMWHNDGTQIYTYTRGNNTYAYEDTSNVNPSLPAPGVLNGRYSPDGGATMQFDFPLDLNNHPRTNIDAAITNLFFWNNLNHDIFYQYGFDEAAGNFQVDNLGRGGQGNDAVRAEALDAFRVGARNNANFFTPVDGNAPRMQMYVWESAPVAPLLVNSPIITTFESIESGFSVNNKLFDVGPVTANVFYTGGIGCSAAEFAGFPPGAIAMVDRGTCSFTIKALNAQAAGAVGLIVVQNNIGAPTTMGGTDNSITMPAVMISMDDGATLKALPNGTVNVSMTTGGPVAFKLGDLDNGIITHEYGHGISTRLVGGPNIGCLGNEEQMGEGWSDYFALMLTTDWNSAAPNDARPIGTYALNQASNSYGIRPFPYSYDMSINPETYANLPDNALLTTPHGVGTVWATMLWDMTWNVIAQVGSVDQDLYHGQGGNNIALQLVIDALKLTPCSPGFVDARDAILKADELRYNGLYRCAIWDAFARRGLGVAADQGSSLSRFDGTASFATDTTVTVFKTTSPGVIREGEVGTINISLSCGCGNGTNSGLTVEDIIGAGLTYVSGGTLSGDTVSFGPLACMGTDTLTVSYQVTADSCIWDLPATLFSETAETSPMVSVENLSGLTNWSKSNTLAHEGAASWYAVDFDSPSDNALVTDPISVTKNSELSFFHRFETESGWDGGVVEYSLDGGSTWYDAQPYMVQNGYTENSGSFFRPLFGGSSEGYFGTTDFVESKISLYALIGQQVKFRFRFLSDQFVGGSGINGWYIDDISVTTVNVAVNETKLFRNGVLEDSVLCLIPLGLPTQSDNIFTCHDRVNISMNGQCLRNIEPEELITTAECANHLLVALSYPKGTNTFDPASTVDVSHIGAEMTYRVIDLVNKNSCWGTIKVEDKYPPIIECSNTTVSCLNAENAAAEVVVGDNCSAYGDPKVEIVSRKWESFDCDADSPLSGYVARVIRATDVWGNFVECNDTIFIIRESLDQLVCPDDVEIECTTTVIRDNKEVELLWNTGEKGDTYLDDQGYAHPWPTDGIGYFPAPYLVSALQGQPDAYFIPVRSDSGPQFDKQGKCQILFEYEDHVLPTCGRSYKIRRTWHIYDWCRGSDFTCVQWFKFSDTKGPEIDPHALITKVEAPISGMVSFTDLQSWTDATGDQDIVLEDFNQFKQDVSFADEPLELDYFSIQRVVDNLYYPVTFDIIDASPFVGPGAVDGTPAAIFEHALEFGSEADHVELRFKIPVTSFSAEFLYATGGEEVNLDVELQTMSGKTSQIAMLPADGFFGVVSGMDPITKISFRSRVDQVQASEAYYVDNIRFSTGLRLRDDYNLVGYSDPHDCKAHLDIPDIRDLVVKECDDQLTVLYEVSYQDQAHPGSTSLLSGEIAEGGKATVYLPQGWHWIRYVIRDRCWNESVVYRKALIEDNTPPTPVCDEITQVTLDPQECWARVYAKDLDDGSHDNCCQQLHFAVANMDSVTYWRNYWHDFFIGCIGESAYNADKDGYETYIEEWINTFVFDDYIDVTECGREQLVLRVYEACDLPVYDPHTFYGGEHEWYWYNHSHVFQAFYLWKLDEFIHYGDPRYLITCEGDYLRYDFPVLAIAGVYGHLDIMPQLTEGGYSGCGLAGLPSNSILELELPELLNAHSPVPWGICSWQIITEEGVEDWKNRVFEPYRTEAEITKRLNLTTPYYTPVRYNDCMIEVIKDDKTPPVVVAPEDVTVYCDGVPYWWELTKPYAGGTKTATVKGHGASFTHDVCEGEDALATYCADPYIYPVGWNTSGAPVELSTVCCVEIPWDGGDFGYYGGSVCGEFSYAGGVNCDEYNYWYESH